MADPNPECRWAQLCQTEALLGSAQFGIRLGTRLDLARDSTRGSPRFGSRLDSVQFSSILGALLGSARSRCHLGSKLYSAWLEDWDSSRLGSRPGSGLRIGSDLFDCRFCSKPDSARLLTRIYSGLDLRLGFGSGLGSRAGPKVQAARPDQLGSACLEG